MMHYCRFCGKAFSRQFNRGRHEAVRCSMVVDEEEGMTSFSNEEENMEQGNEKYYRNNEDGDDEEEAEEETDESDTDIKNNEVNPWDKLREEVIHDLNSTWTEQVEENLRQGLSKDDAQIQVSNRLLPVYRKRLRYSYSQYLRWYYDLKIDPVHKKVMKTLRRFMEDDEMDYTEAVEAAVS